MQNPKKKGNNRRRNNSSGNRTDRLNAEKDVRRDREIRDTAEREGKSDMYVSRRNDVSWYTNFPQFAADVATLPFSTPLGTPLQLVEPGLPSDLTHKVYVPGVMRIGFFPTIGVSKDLSSPINRSSLRFYSALRNKQKASAPYDQADAMLSMVALDSLYMFWAFIRRAYGVAQLFSPVNQYYPKALLQAMGISTTILDNLAEFRIFINRYAISLGQFATPKFDMLLRHQWMCSGLYSDQPTTRAQTYLFVPDGFWQFDNTASVGTTLNWVQWQDPTVADVTQHTLEDIQQLGNQLIAALAGDEDIGRITGDIYAAFGPENTFKAEETPDGYSVLPAYNEMVLAQVENLKLCNGWAATYTPVITQNPSVNNGAIIFQPRFRGTFTPLSTDFYDFRNRCENILNAHLDKPTPDFVLEATRLIYSAQEIDATGSGAASKELNVLSCGSDVATNIRIWTRNINTDGFTSLKINTNAIYPSVDTDQQIASLIANVAPFDWHPILYVFDDIDPTPAVQNEWLAGFFGDIDNVTPLPDNQLAMMHEAAMLSLFDIPLNVIQA